MIEEEEEEKSKIIDHVEIIDTIPNTNNENRD
jgi:hypothetical protein